MEYYYCNPTGNITILVDEEAPVQKQPEISNYLCEIEPTCEQVGFIYRNEPGCDIRLRMAGGEFCGNATMSTAALFCKENGLNVGENRKVLVRVSGVNNPLYVDIKAIGKKEFLGRVEMPDPKGIITKELCYEGTKYDFTIVMFDGMYHIVYKGLLEKEFVERAIKKWCAELDAPAFGIMMINEKTDELTPLVYVRNVDSLYWEHSCGSGTAAAGFCYFMQEKRAITKCFSEPSGVLTIEADERGKLFLSGKVVIEDKRLV